MDSKRINNLADSLSKNIEEASEIMNEAINSVDFSKLSKEEQLRAESKLNSFKTMIQKQQIDANELVERYNKGL